MTDHERIEELLTGYALLALEGEDAAEADRLLSEHVPSCPTCREMLAGLRAVTGELALVPAPATPPDLTLARIHREMGHVPVPRRRRAGMLALAASVVALVGLAGLSVSLGGRATRAEDQRGTALALLNAMQQPGADPVALEGSAAAIGATRSTRSSLTPSAASVCGMPSSRRSDTTQSRKPVKDASGRSR